MTYASWLFVDFRVEDFETLLSGIKPGTGVTLLSPDRDGVAQISEVLEMLTSVREIHIVSHGSPGCLELGNSSLSLKTLDEYAPQLNLWSMSFSQTPHILLYGCRVAAGDVGTEFVERLGALTGAMVAASATPTGSTALGGNWELEVTTGEMKVPVAFSESARSAYAGVLEITRVGAVSPLNLYDRPSISGDGRYVGFHSPTDNLVPGDTNNSYDVFVYDQATGEIDRVSISSDGTPGDGWSTSSSSSISGDGRYVVFASSSSNLVPGDTNDDWDIFVHDRQTRETTLVSVATDGTQANSSSFPSSISENGRYVVFESFADNLVPGDTNKTNDVFVHDRVTGETTRVSVASDGTQGNYPYQSDYRASISGDGRYVAFNSKSSNLAPGDTDDRDVFVHDRQTGETTLVPSSSNVFSAGSGGSISGNGRYVVFDSDTSQFLHSTRNVFVYDRETGETTLVSVDSNENKGNSYSYDASISSDGRYVAFSSDASNLVPGDTGGQDVFVRDLQTGTTRLISTAYDGSPANFFSEYPTISANGNYVAFASRASNLVPGDTNQANDFFVTSVGDGNNQNDNLVGSAANDLIYGYGGDDTLQGKAGDDSLYGGTENDYLYGAGGDDRLFGVSGNDVLRGREGNDYLNGGEGLDILSGALDNDTLNGGGWNDSLTGGEGQDWFEFDTDSYSSFNLGVMGTDRIRDFVSGVDRIILDKTTFNRIASDAGDGFSITSEFAVVTSDGRTSDAWIVYNSTTGSLNYNWNGSNPGWGSNGQGGKFALLDDAPPLTASDFTLVA